METSAALYALNPPASTHLYVGQQNDRKSGDIVHFLSHTHTHLVAQRAAAYVPPALRGKPRPAVSLHNVCLHHIISSPHQILYYCRRAVQTSRKLDVSGLE